MAPLRGLMNFMAPEIEDTHEALQRGLESLTFTNGRRRNPVAFQTRSPAPAQIVSPQRVETSPPPIPERNPNRPGHPLRSQQIQQVRQFGPNRQPREISTVVYHGSLGIPQPQLDHHQRTNFPGDATVSRYLRETRPPLQGREPAPEVRREDQNVQEVGNSRVDPVIHRGLDHPQPRSIHPVIHQGLHHPQPRRVDPVIHQGFLHPQQRRVDPVIHQGLHHPQSRRVDPVIHESLDNSNPRSFEPDMAGIRRTGYLDVAVASTQRITPHQIFLKGQAKRQQDATDEWARRTGKSAPPYQFEDFIGKGAYGRVFKAVHRVSQKQVAIKVMDADAVDIRANAKFRDESIKEFMHETKVLKKLAGAPNVNQIFDVMEVEAQLWIVSEYVPGGSIKSLMQSSGGKLDEVYILVIAREVAKGLRAIHNAGIIHRDIKAANIMVHEEGRVQIIDFGVAGLMETKTDRRGTIIGTFNWMAPEVLKHAKGPLPDDRQAPGGIKFGVEIDVWSYGCTLFEMAKGKPPNAGLMTARQIESMLKRMNPKLKPEDGFSQDLCNLVAYVLELDPQKRPSMEDVLRHPYIDETDYTQPTTTLRQLIKVYEAWASSGGQRQSLIQPSGAAPAEFPEDPKDDAGWRFSVVNIGDSAYENVDQPIPSFHIDPAMDPTMDLEMAQREENNLNSLIPESSYTPDASPRLPSNLADHPDNAFDSTHVATMKTTASEESRIRGVGARFADFFEGAGYSGSEATQPAESSRPRSDLALRNDASESDASQKENKKKLSFRGTPVDTTRANQSEQPVERRPERDARRGTLLQTWDFDSTSRPAQEPQHDFSQGPSILPGWNEDLGAPKHSIEDLGAPGDDVEVDGRVYAFPSRPAVHNFATAPSDPPMLHNNIDTATSRHTLDLDALMNGDFAYDAPTPQLYNSPAPYQPYANVAAPTAMSDTHDYGYDAPSTRNDYQIEAVSPTTRAQPQDEQDDQSQYATITGHSNTNGSSSYDLTEHARGTYNGLTHTPPDSLNGSPHDEMARPSPPTAAAMAYDAPTEVREAELLRQALGYEQALREAAELWGAEVSDTDGEEDDEDVDEGNPTGQEDN